MAFLLGCEKAGIDFPSKTVFDELSLGIDDGDRIGIVGRNGDGKSTLIGMLAGEIEPDRGRVIRTNGVTVGLLGQRDALADVSTVGEAIVGDRPEYEWAGDARIRGIIAGIAGDIPWDASIGTLSGGLSEISSNSEQLKGGAKQVFDTLLSTAGTQIAAAGLPAP